MNEEMLDLVDLLDEQIDDVTEALQPLLTTPLQDISSKLPVVDKARLSVLTTYAIESLLFSYLRLNGVNAKEHPVMRELTRVRQYVQKINEAQAGPAKREVVLNKEVAGRFIKHGLAGNEKWDRERAEQQAKERANAHIKFEELSRKIERREAEKEDQEQAEKEDNVQTETDIDGAPGEEEDETTLSEVEKTITKTTEPQQRSNDLPTGDKKSKNEEQVNRILDTFKNHGVLAGGSKRKHEGKNPEVSDGKKVRRSKKNKNKKAGTGKDEAPEKRKKRHRNRPQSGALN